MLLLPAVDVHIFASVDPVPAAVAARPWVYRSFLLAETESPRPETSELLSLKFGDMISLPVLAVACFGVLMCSRPFRVLTRSLRTVIRCMETRG